MFSNETRFSHFVEIEVNISVADPGSGQGGGPRIFLRDFADISKRSLASKANNIIFQYKRIWEF